MADPMAAAKALFSSAAATSKLADDPEYQAFIRDFVHGGKTLGELGMVPDSAPTPAPAPAPTPAPAPAPARRLRACASCATANATKGYVANVLFLRLSSVNMASPNGQPV